MCGICGIVSFKKSEFISERKINKMTSMLAHRGPDFKKTWLSNGVALGHTRLSILDLSKNGNQPMLSFDKKYVIILNGEIYNYTSIRKKLRSFNISFKGTSDTEVLVNAFSVWGSNVFKKLNGIFALAIYDIQNKKIILARDRYGVKPLYFSYDGEVLLFGSEIKSIIGSRQAMGKINPQSLHEFSFFGNPLQSNTMFKSIKKLKAGQVLRFNSSGIKMSKFWEISPKINGSISEVSAINNVRRLLNSAVKSQLVSDVPVGIFLSGGIDSSAVTAFATKHYNGVLKTFTANFDFMPENRNELNKAKKVANYFGTDHYEMDIKSDDLPNIIESLISCHDEPFSDSANIPLYLMCRELPKEVKVILQGDGGDELFAGYKRYSVINNYLFWRTLSKIPLGVFDNFQNSTIKRFSRILKIFGQKDWGDTMGMLLTTDTASNSFFNLLSVDTKNILKGTDPFKEYKKLERHFSQFSRVNQMLFTDLKIILSDTFLEKVDKSTMAHGKESRVPFLDNNLAEYVLGLPSNLKIKGVQKKYLLKKSLHNVVPEFVLNSPKMGFGVPFSNWLKGPLRNYLLDNLLSKNLREKEVFDTSSLQLKIKNFERNNNQHDAFILWKALNFSIWLSKYKVTLN